MGYVQGGHSSQASVSMCDVTHILGKAESSDPSAAEQLLPLVEGLQPRLVVVLIGNNNMFFTPETGIEAAAKGMPLVVANVRERFPKAEVILEKIFPAHTPGNRFYEDAKKTNDALETLKVDSDPKVHLLDLTGDLTNEDGTLKPELFASDQIHLSPEAGYDTYARRLQPLVERLLKK